MVKMNDEAIIAFELLQSEFWPARSIRNLNGWIINEDNGVTWRANSVFPYGSVTEKNVEDQISSVVEFYRSKGYAPAFKMTSSCNPPDLDKRLGQRGFEKKMITQVQTLNLTRVELHPDLDITLEIHQDVTDEWLERQRVDKRYRGPGLAILEGILERIPGVKGFVLVRSQERVVAVGLGVVHKEWLALFSIRVDDDWRRRGIGRIISKSLINWGLENGAKKAFLQVEEDNGPALALYNELGFRTLYEYWYRILPKSPR
jgi:GNAT superfamily N-acetyltransferase